MSSREMRRLRVKSAPDMFGLVVEDVESGMLLPALEVVIAYYPNRRPGVIDVSMKLDVEQIDLDHEMLVEVTR
jgi:hypothetical protein